MRKIKVVIVLIALGYVAQGCKEIKGTNKYEGKVVATENPITVNGWETLTMTNYSIQYPKDWYYEKSGDKEIDFFLISKSEMENINLLIDDYSQQGIDLNTYIEMTEAQIKSELPDAKMSESLRLSSNKGDFHRIIYTANIYDRDMTFEQHISVKNNVAYILTFSGGQEDFEDTKIIGEKILNTFDLK